MKRHFFLSLIGIMLLSCNRNEPTVVTNSPTDVTSRTAICSGSVTSDDPNSVTDKGIICSIYDNPTLDGVYAQSPSVYHYVSAGPGTGDFSFEINFMSPNTTYYVRAYAVCDDETYYGDVESLMTVDQLVVKTYEPESVTSTSAVLRGWVISDGGVLVNRQIWLSSDTYPPTIWKVLDVGESVAGDFEYEVTGLTPNKTYYAMTYAYSDIDHSCYGDTVTFTTLRKDFDADGEINGHTYVDLGLPSGLKWATCNVGADYPEESGGYYAWGETSTKQEYTKENSLTYDMELGDISGNPQYDAARANWGSTWKMPTYDDFLELINNCSWEFLEDEYGSSVDGFKATAANGKSVFFPLAGCYDDTSLGSVNNVTHIWTSTPQDSIMYCETKYCSSEFRIDIYSGQTLRWFLSRKYGFNIRAVSE